jgi:uncharacterized protein YjbI with pentapeptide repeats
MNKSSQFWDDRCVSQLRHCESTQLRDLAEALGADASTFFRRADFRGIDLRGQDLRGMDLSEARFKGSIVDSTTLIDVPLENLFGFPSKSALLGIFRDGLIPQFGRRDLILRIVSGITAGIRISHIEGAAGVGKSPLMWEIRNLLEGDRDVGFVAPPSLQEFLSDHVVLAFAAPLRIHSADDAILRAMANMRVGEAHRQLLMSLLQGDLFSSAINIQLDLFESGANVFRHVYRNFAHDEKRKFLVSLFNRLDERFPGSICLLFVDDIHHRLDPQDFADLMRQAKCLYLVCAGRRLGRLGYYLEDNSVPISRAIYLLDQMPRSAISQMFDWLENKASGAVKFPKADRESTVDMVDGKPRVLVAALRLAVLYALGTGQGLPVQYSTALLRRAANFAGRELGLDKLRRSREDGQRLSYAAKIALLDSLLVTDLGATEVEMSRALGVPQRIIRSVIGKLLRRGFVRESGTRYAVEQSILTGIMGDTLKQLAGESVPHTSRPRN